MHWNGKNWTRLTLPWAVDPVRVAADGSGGIWISALGSHGAGWMVHRTAAGRWTRTRLAPASAAAFGLARVPGTTAVWAAGPGP